MGKQHHYKATIQWTGNKGTGTDHYRNYARSHNIRVENKLDILGSSDPAFRGDKTKHNPEDLFISSISACHMLWFLHLCAEAGVIVVDYVDNATGIMEEDAGGAGRFTEVTLTPMVTVTESAMLDPVNELHEKANRLCFIANSLNFKVKHNPTARTRSLKDG